MTQIMDPLANGHAEDAEKRVLDAFGNEFTPASLAELAKSAIPVERAVGYGVRAVRHPEHVPEEISRYWVVDDGHGLRRHPGMLFEWRDTDRTTVQFRPDEPVEDGEGKRHKYVFPSGCGAVLNHLRPGDPQEPVLFVEGTKQALSAAVWAPREWGVVGMSGCWGWRGTDLSWAEGRRIVLFFDKDVGANRDVHDAATAVKEALEGEGADGVVFARLPGAGAKDGLDDVIGRRAEGKRGSWLVRVVGMARGTLGRAPARRQENPYFGPKGLLAKTASEAVLDGQPGALAKGSMIALYRGGVFLIDQTREPLIRQVKEMLGEEYRPNWRATIEEYLVGELSGRDLRIPEKADAPLLNCANTMLDLRTGESLEHDPKYLSVLQIPVEWDPGAECPTYEAWLEEVCPDQGEALEEIAATMLDPSRTPQRAAFLFGPSKSGKSTFLRIMAAVAGPGNTSAVTLHQMSDNKFMAANIYGKMLNAAADLSAAMVSDTSLFKMMTGEDLIEADRKYGHTFRFTNRALFAFSANEIPPVNETSRAYLQRITPFRFGYSFAGHEKPEIEERILKEELPGVLARWGRAWRRFHERGLYLPIDEGVSREFETKSDRVARWVSLRCDVHPEAAGTTVGAESGEQIQRLYDAFKLWVKDEGPAAAMSRAKFGERLRNIKGVGGVRLSHRGTNPGLNITLRTGEDREVHFVQVQPEKGGVAKVGRVGSHPISTIRVALSENDQGGERVSAKDMAVIGGEPTLPTLPTLPSKAAQSFVNPPTQATLDDDQGMAATPAPSPAPGGGDDDFDWTEGS